MYGDVLIAGVVVYDYHDDDDDDDGEDDNDDDDDDRIDIQGQRKNLLESIQN